MVANRYDPREGTEIIAASRRRRHWTAAEKVQMVEETFRPGATVTTVARLHGVATNQLFTWRRLVTQGLLARQHADGMVVAVSVQQTLQRQIRELQRLLGQKTLENELLRRALEQEGIPSSTAETCSGVPLTQGD